MPNSITVIYLQLVLVVKHRRAMITEDIEDRVMEYLSGIVKNHGHILLAIGGMPDHIHIFIRYRPSEPLPRLMQELKRDTSLWINKNHLTPAHFEWQTGYGAFSYSEEAVNTVIHYIRTQKEHHLSKPFLAEFKQMCESFKLQLKDEYNFTELI